MTVDPATALVFGVIGTAFGMFLKYWLDKRSGDRELKRTLWLEALDDTTRWYYAYWTWVGQVARSRRSRRGTQYPEAKDYPKLDQRLLGDHELSHEIADFELSLTDTTHAPGMSPSEVEQWESLGERINAAFTRQRDRVLGGSKPKYVQHQTDTPQRGAPVIRRYE